MANKFIEYFHFGKSERNAILIVVVIIILLFVVPGLYFRSLEPEAVKDDLFVSEITEFLRQEELLSQSDQRGFDFTRPDKEAARERIRPYEFDPNLLDESGWVKLGFSKKQAEGIIKYRDKGGRFLRKEDLRRLYAVDDEIYRILEPYIKIEVQSVVAQKSGKDGVEKQGYSPAKGAGQVELNGADSSELVSVKGIGPAFARRIIRYREKLGGFSDVGQLLEVYGIDSAHFSRISKGVFVDASLIRKIDINSATMDELRKHPYIDYYIAKAIVDTRIINGAYLRPEELLEIKLIYNELYIKLVPYIAINKK